MPVYEYQCLANGHRFDLFQAVGAAPPACPMCGSASRKVYSSVGLIFKGSGFHVTDYRRPGATDGAGPEKAGEQSEGKAAAAADKGGGKAKNAAESSTGGAEKSGGAASNG